MIPFPVVAAIVAPVPPAPDAVKELAAPVLAEVRGYIDKQKEPAEKAGLYLRIAEAEHAMGNAAGAKAALAQAAAVVQANLNAPNMPLAPVMVASTYHDLGDDAGAKAFLAGIVPLAKKVTDAQARFYTLQQTAMAQAYVGDAAGAKATFAEVKAAAPKAGAEAAAGLPKAEADLLGQLGDFAGAKRTLAAGKVKDPANEAMTLAYIAEKQAKARDRAGAQATMKEAAATLAKVKDPGYRGFLASTLAAYYAKIGDATSARRLAGKDPQALRNLAEALAEAGDIPGAKAAYPKPTPALAYALAEKGDIAGARKAAEAVIAAREFTMSDEPVRLWAALAVAQAKAGDKSGAAASLAKARKIATTSDPILGDNSAANLASLLQALFTGGKRDVG
jgi:hypothetical protein